MRAALKIAIAVAAMAAATSAGSRRSIVLERANIQDQTGSASGYVYQSNGNGPASVLHYTSNQHNLGYPPITLGTHGGHYINAPPPPPVIYTGGPLPYAYPEYKYPAQAQGHQLQQSAVVHKGSAHDGNNYSAHGAKGDKGYKTNEEYDKANHGQYAKKHDEGHYDSKGGNKAGSHESEGHYAKHHAEGEGSKGGHFNTQSSHRKGSKTTGFHKVYHKDEYKKDHTFYDESDSSGDYEKYGKQHAEHGAEKGGFAKGGSEKAGFSQGGFGKKGFFDKGAYDKADSGHRQAEGSDKYYGDEANFKNYGSQSSDKEYKY